jgi:hypothetical protein
MSGAAFAHETGPGTSPTPPSDPSTNVSGAVAVSNQDGAVIGAFAKGTLDGNSLSTVSPTGLANIQQNGGANSILQDQNTLGAILGCSCSSSNNSADLSLAASNQSALVLGAVSIGAQSRSETGSDSGAGFQFVAAGGQESSGGHSSSGFLGHDSSGGQEASGFLVAAGGGSHYDTWDNASSYQASANSAYGIGGTGLINVSQNTGNNSMLQAGNTVAAITGTTLP